jgi:hypothetical protein
MKVLHSVRRFDWPTFANLLCATGVSKSIFKSVENSILGVRTHKRSSRRLRFRRGLRSIKGLLEKLGPYTQKYFAIIPKRAGKREKRIPALEQLAGFSEAADE